MADTILVAYSQRLQETVDRVMGPNSLSVNQGRRERGHNSLANKEIAAGGGGGGSVGIGRLKSLPSVGSGRGTYVSLTVNTEGELVETGAAKPVIIPRIYHIN